MTAAGAATKIEATATCLSWIPSHAIKGALKLPFALRVTHFDAPPPAAQPDVEALLATDAIRFANQLRAWIYVKDDHITDFGMGGGGRLGATTVRLASRSLTFAAIAMPEISAPPEAYPDRVRFTQTAGGHTGAVIPRRVSHPPYVRLTAPLAWTTVSLTVRVDGSSDAGLSGASPFPRHYLYDSEGRLTHESALIRYHDWLRRADESESPWGGMWESAPVAEVRSGIERRLADAMLTVGGIRENSLASEAMLSSRQIADTEVHLLLDGILVIEYDGRPVLEAGPGAIFDPSLRTPESKRHVTVRARTPCRLAVLRRDQLDSEALLGVAAQQTARLRAQPPPT